MKRTSARKLVLFALSSQLFTVIACQTRRYNPNAQSLSETFDAQSQDPAEYFGLPKLVKGNTKAVAFLIRTVPMLTHGSYEYAEKLAETELGTGWAVKPWGTERYTHAVYPVSKEALSGWNEAKWIEVQDKFVKIGGKRLLPPKQAKLAKDGGVVVLTTDDLNRKSMLELDNAGHQENANILVADYKNETDNNPKAFEATVPASAFNSVTSERISSTDPLWSLKFGRVFEAWQYLSKTKGIAENEAGKGVRIGVIDTGFLPDHSEFKTPRKHNVKWQEGSNTLENDKSSVDKFLFNVQPPNPGHGSAVMAIMSSQIPPEAGSLLAFTSGLIPGAEIIPVRSTSSTVYKNAKAIGEAVNVLVDKNVQVISISLGGWPERSLEAALERAQKAGIIVLAAAGNGTPFVSAPAIYPSVLAIGAGTLECKAWSKSSPGIEVDVLAPGENVWYPASYKDQKGNMQWSLRRGSGTSFATPYVASLAAMWIQANGGFEELKKRYGNGDDFSAIPKAFELALKYYGLKLPKSHPAYDNQFQNPTANYCTGFDASKKGKTGAGMVDAFNLVKAPLPSSDNLKLYEPNLSEQGKFVLKNYAAIQHQFFYGFEMDPLLEKSTDPISKNIRNWFGSDPIQTKNFVRNYLSDKYAGARNISKIDSSNENGTEDQASINLGFEDKIKSVMKKCGEAAKTVANIAFQCDVRWAWLGKNYLNLIDPADGIYFIKVFQYLQAYNKEKNLPFGDEQKRKVIEDLLDGQSDWIPEDL